MKKKKSTGIVLIVLWIIFSVIMILINCKNYSAIDYLIVFAVALCPVTIYVIYRLIKHSKKKSDHQHIQSATLTNVAQSIATIPQTNNSNSFQINRPSSSEIDQEELLFQFGQNYYIEINRYTQSFEECNRRAYEASSLDEKIRLLNQTIINFEKAKEWFYRSKAGMIYFQTYYEHLHNSSNACFSYIDPVKDYLDECVEERDMIVPKIIELASSEDGVLQKDLYQYFDTSKGQIQQIVKKMEEQEIIRREKKGNTYLISKQ